LSLPRWLATYRDGLPANRWSPIRVLTGPGVSDYVDRDQRITAKQCYHWLIAVQQFVLNNDPGKLGWLNRRLK